ncbi:tripartite tricarboxylate transporter substrate binding protein [Chelatococcus sp. GCM10030263]|uniref:tripartite tricarboxylate transporter substrate binding protein n=1 Tax=Chelatococcus sp. GCM10030263 TaxID=3273387 RepID=UPI003620A769
MRSLLKSLAFGLTAALLGLAPAAHAEYPERPITLIVPWGAGGGTDATARIIGSLLEKELGQPINVVNRTGGNGVVGHSAIASASPDGYTIGMLTVEIAMMHWQGLTKLTPADYTPIALMNNDPAGLQVREDAPYKSVKDVFEAIKANPGSLKASGTGQGGIWHLAIAGMLDAAGLKPGDVPWVPSNGAAPGLQDLVAGGVQLVPCSIPEARSLIDAKRVRSLVIMADKRNPTLPDVPTLKEETGLDWTMGAWRGIAAPKGLPQDIADKLTAALEKINKSEEFQKFMNDRGFGISWAPGQEFGAFMAKSDESLGAVMKKVGLAR